MTRIIAGTAGGRRIETPRGSATRPTTDRVREALFSSLTSLIGDWEDVRGLDVFSGSGANGLEMLSRGARDVTLIESDRRTADLIRRNIATLRLEGARVVAAPALRAVAELTGPYDVAFFDPPYALSEDDLAELLEAVDVRGLIAPDGIVVIERSQRSPEPRWPAGLSRFRRRKYGQNMLWYGQRHA